MSRNIINCMQHIRKSPKCTLQFLFKYLIASFTGISTLQHNSYLTKWMFFKYLYIQYIFAFPQLGTKRKSSENLYKILLCSQKRRQHAHRKRVSNRSVYVSGCICSFSTFFFSFLCISIQFFRVLNSHLKSLLECIASQS